MCIRIRVSVRNSRMVEVSVAVQATRHESALHVCLRGSARWPDRQQLPASPFTAATISEPVTRAGLNNACPPPAHHVVRLLDEALEDLRVSVLAQLSEPSRRRRRDRRHRNGCVAPRDLDSAPLSAAAATLGHRGAPRPGRGAAVVEYTPRQNTGQTAAASLCWHRRQ